MNTESVGLGFNTSSLDLDAGNQEQPGSALASEGLGYHDALLGSDWLRRDMANSVLNTPD
jgi:hypothetical protein